jgi:threonine synthase
MNTYSPSDTTATETSLVSSFHPAFSPIPGLALRQSLERPPDSRDPHDKTGGWPPDLKDRQDCSSPYPPLRVGHTPVSEIPAISDYVGLRRLLIKDESHNPFGTHKDRKSYYAVQNFCDRRNPPDALCLITAGNAGLSLAAFAWRRHVPVVAVVGSLAPPIRLKLELACEQVLQLDLQNKYWSSRELRYLIGVSQGRRVIDITNLASPYQQLAFEIARHEPDAVVLPVGGGELFVGLAAGLRALGAKTRLIGVTTRRQDTLADKLYARWAPYRDRVHWLTGSGFSHQLFYLDDESTLSDTLKAVGQHIRCEFSSAVAFDILRRLSFKATEKVMVVNTGAFRENIWFDTA